MRYVCWVHISRYHPSQTRSDLAFTPRILSDYEDSKEEIRDMRRQGTNFSSMSSSGDIELETIIPADYDLPETHVVQALNNRYIHASILTEALDVMWPENWGMVVSLNLPRLQMVESVSTRTRFSRRHGVKRSTRLTRSNRRSYPTTSSSCLGSSQVYVQNIFKYKAE
jgi:hypothetical protein